MYICIHVYVCIYIYIYIYVYTHASHFVRNQGPITHIISSHIISYIISHIANIISLTNVN